MLAPELAQLLAAIDAVEAEAKKLLDGLTDAQANWQPDQGRRWSIAQCLDHLARINPYYVSPFLQAVEQARAAARGEFRTLAPTWFGRMFVRTLEPPPRGRLRANRVALPASSMPAATVLESYVRGHQGYRKLVQLANDVDVNRVTQWNPFIRFVRMRIATVLLVVPAHDRRHLWQARQVLHASGFPR